MIDSLKLFSKKLNINIKVIVYLPDDYNTSDKVYNAYYFLLARDLKLENKINSNSVSFFIFPNSDIEKNKLLFDSSLSDYDFSFLYKDFILNEVKILLEERYRISNKQNMNSIIGYNETSNLALNIALTYTDMFKGMFILPLSLDKKKITLILSKFNPNLDYNLYSENKKLITELKDKLIMFGAPYINIFSKNDINEVIKLINSN